MPDMSFRVDPFNALLEGRLRIEGEIELLDWLTLEAMPTFIIWREPPSFNLSGRHDRLSQRGAFGDAFAGGRLGLGFWLGGKPFRGYVLRLVYVGERYKYISDFGDVDPALSFNGDTKDMVTDKDQRLFLFFGSHAKWGFFTIAGGIGLGFDLNNKERCFAEDGSGDVLTSGCDGELQLAVDPNLAQVFNIYPSIHPVYLEARFSLGVVF